MYCTCTCIYFKIFCVFSVAIEAVAKKLFEKVLNLLEDKVNDATILFNAHYFLYYQASTKEGNRELEDHAQLLLFKFNHIRGRIKRISDQFLTDLVEK